MQRHTTVDFEVAPAPLALHGKSESSEFAGGSRVPAWGVPVLPSGARPSLPKGCYVGVPVVAATPARSLPEGKALFQFAMSIVENDDYYGVVELVRASNGTLDLQRKIGFSVAPRPEAGVIDANFPRQLKVRAANLLHYAICIGSFRAAAAVLVACPAMLQGKCFVSMVRTEGVIPAEEEAWGPSELARIFCVLYAKEGNPGVRATCTQYNLARRVLERGEEQLSHLPFVALPTVAQRIAAAGVDSETVIAALFAAAAIADTAMVE
jgi:hypothetical protein